MFNFRLPTRLPWGGIAMLPSYVGVRQLSHVNIHPNKRLSSCSVLAKFLYLKAHATCRSMYTGSRPGITTNTDAMYCSKHLG